MSLAIFDLDDTLTFQDTETLWLNFLVNNNYLDSEYVSKCQEQFSSDYQNGCLNFNEVISLSFKPIISLSLNQQQCLQDQFKNEVLKHYILPLGQQLVEHHRQQGDHVIIISAGHEFLIHPAVSFFNAHHTICTKVKKNPIDGRFLPQIDGHAIYKEKKVTEYKKWLKQSNKIFDKTYFYSDSINDLPLFNCVDIPTAVNPCPKLKKLAQNKDWEILNLKQGFTIEQSINEF